MVGHRFLSAPSPGPAGVKVGPWAQRGHGARWARRGRAEPTASPSPTVAASRSVALRPARGPGHLGAEGTAGALDTRWLVPGGTPWCRSPVPGGRRSTRPPGSEADATRPAGGRRLPVSLLADVRLVKVVRPRLRLRALHLDQPRRADPGASCLLRAVGGEEGRRGGATGGPGTRSIRLRRTIAESSARTRRWTRWRWPKTAQPTPTLGESASS